MNEFHELQNIAYTQHKDRILHKVLICINFFACDIKNIYVKMCKVHLNISIGRTSILDVIVLSERL